MKRLEDLSTKTLIDLARVMSGDPATVSQRVLSHADELKAAGRDADLSEFTEGVLAFDRELREALGS